ncbi:thymidine kinase [Klebsiella phage N1M2]|uniref:Thymidine kinase n=1 Tax=Klebsiella phage N1M2 TaxID=2664939 RepID=A0A6B7ZFD5_9CAUD|nr:thymidine kinase [Klebsiella phage N1M2]QGH72059.1 thymidine kinase [Klebsiella phage N1M2]
MSSLYFYHSSMNAGKSTTLLQANYNYHERGMKTLVLKPAIDTREGKAVIRSRIGLEAECVMFEKHDNLFWVIQSLIGLKPNPHCILIDEAQFLTKEQVIQLSEIVDQLDVPVLCYGLRSDFQGNLFPGSAALFALADKLERVKTICWCGRSAHMVLRLDSEGKVVREGQQVDVGGNDKYISVCRKHFKSGQTHA